jgi:hypothetical protein
MRYSRPELPRLYLVKQRFDETRIQDLPAHLAAQLEFSGVSIPGGARIAIAVGSRGIRDLQTVVQGVVGWVRQQGGEPFLVPAMGSHGGATAEGQQAVLEHYGVTEELVGAPIRSSMEVVELPHADCPVPVYFDRYASEADGTIVINRVKPHTDYHGPYESGLMKLMVIGLGKHAQALAVHSYGVRGLRDIMPVVARQVLAHANILLGVAIVENEYDRTCALEAIPASRIPDREPALLAMARSRMASLPVDELDLLIVDEMGKDISGTGMDSNVIGRMLIAGETEPAAPRIGRIVVRGMSRGSEGNAAGIGFADVVHRRLRDAVDWAATYENTVTSTFLLRAKIPVTAETDAEMLAIALRSLGPLPLEELRLARIRSTLALDTLVMSQAAIDTARESGRIEVVDTVGQVWEGDELGAFPGSG